MSCRCTICLAELPKRYLHQLPRVEGRTRWICRSDKACVRRYASNAGRRRRDLYNRQRPSK